MPRKYARKPGVVPRCRNWTETSLALAFEELNKKEKSLRKISQMCGIPSRTIRRRYKLNKLEMLSLGKPPELGFENEKKLAAHILKLEEAGFIPDRREICRLAYLFAEKLKLKHKFNKNTKTAGREWLKSFLERNPLVTVIPVKGSRNEDLDDQLTEDSVDLFELGEHGEEPATEESLVIKVENQDPLDDQVPGVYREPGSGEQAQEFILDPLLTNEQDELPLHK